MLIFTDIKVDPERELSSLDKLWEVWEEETKAALGALEAGKLVALYKVSGQRGACWPSSMSSPPTSWTR